MRGVTSIMVMQGRELDGADIGLIRGLLDEHPEWCRSRLSEERCRRWDWRNAQGRIKDMAARNTVGENIRYLVRDRLGRPVACLLFGSAAWKCAERDTFIGWEPATRQGKLQWLTNNTRFLIAPWVVIPHLASHVLGLVSRRIRGDWQCKYGHPVLALETFVDRDRFKGTCYRAANWVRLGETRGRTRNDRDHCIRAAVKDVYIYPLVANFRRGLCPPSRSATEGRAR